MAKIMIAPGCASTAVYPVRSVSLPSLIGQVFSCSCSCWSPVVSSSGGLRPIQRRPTAPRELQGSRQE